MLILKIAVYVTILAILRPKMLKKQGSRRISQGFWLIQQSFSRCRMNILHKCLTFPSCEFFFFFLYKLSYDENSITAWKVSVFEVILVHIFPHSDWIWRDMKYLSVFSLNAGKYSSKYGHFLRSSYCVRALFFSVKLILLYIQNFYCLLDYYSEM